jgi:hypothetical protein
VHTLKVRNQAKQVAHFGPSPPISISFSKGQLFSNTGPQAENNQVTQVPQAGPPVTRLHNSDKKWDREKATDHMRIKIYIKYT